MQPTDKKDVMERQCTIIFYRFEVMNILLHKDSIIRIRKLKE